MKAETMSPKQRKYASFSSYRMLWDLRLISFQQRFISPVWWELLPLGLRHSVASSGPSPSTVDWHGTHWHPGHEGRRAATQTEEHNECLLQDDLFEFTLWLLHGGEVGNIKQHRLDQHFDPLTFPQMEMMSHIFALKPFLWSQWCHSSDPYSVAMKNFVLKS